MNHPPLAAQSADDIAEAKRAADEQFKEAVEIGFQHAIVDAELDDGNGNLDRDRLEDRIFDILKTKHVVETGSTNDDRYNAETSSTKDELTADIFTAGPSVTDAEKNDVTKAVYKKCQGAVWNLTAPGQRGRIQSRLEADKLLLVRGKVYREGNPINDGVFVTTHPEIVVRELIGPQLEKLRKLGDAIEDDFKMATERVPELDAPIRASIESALIEASAKMPVKALGAGPNGRKAVEKK